MSSLGAGVLLGVVIAYDQELDVPPGDATMRVGIYDGRSQKMGAMEFPLTVKTAAQQGAAK